MHTVQVARRLGILAQLCNNGVDEVTILEPFESEIVSQKINLDNIYYRIVSIMKQSTQEYYNMRIILGLKVD